MCASACIHPWPILWDSCWEVGRNENRIRSSYASKPPGWCLRGCRWCPACWACNFAPFWCCGPPQGGAGAPVPEDMYVCVCTCMRVYGYICTCMCVLVCLLHLIADVRKYGCIYLSWPHSSIVLMSIWFSWSKFRRPIWLSSRVPCIDQPLGCRYCPPMLSRPTPHLWLHWCTWPARAENKNETQNGNRNGDDDFCTSVNAIRGSDLYVLTLGGLLSRGNEFCMIYFYGVTSTCQLFVQDV